MQLRALLAGLVLLGCGREAEPPAPPAARPELTFEGLSLRVYRKGLPQLSVRAPHVELMRTTGALSARDARFDFFVDAVTLEAPVLSGNIDTLSFDATGGVTFASSGGASQFVATTARAHFEGRSGARGLATGSDPIAVSGVQGGHPFSLTATGFRFDVEQQHATFEQVQSKVGAP